MRNLKRLLITGGAGFIGSAFIRYLLRQETGCERVVNLDLLTYAADLRNLLSDHQDPRYLFIQGDICDETLVEKICLQEKIEGIVHFAAETHVDRSIADPKAFVRTNVQGTVALLEVVRRLPHLHFHHISTDEVYGSLTHGAFTEETPYHPNSPYAASKAASDHFVKAYAATYGISTTLSHCTNNYGPFQHVEKFIPRMIVSCLYKEPLPLYGDGLNVRDWLFVDDHSEAIWKILEKGKAGEVYNIGGACEKKNREVVDEIITLFAQLRAEDPNALRSLVVNVADRPGHDRRYAIDFNKLHRELGWKPAHDFSSGLRKTLTWYLEHQERMSLV